MFLIFVQKKQNAQFYSNEEKKRNACLYFLYRSSVMSYCASFGFLFVRAQGCPSLLHPQLVLFSKHDSEREWGVNLDLGHLVSRRFVSYDNFICILCSYKLWQMLYHAGQGSYMKVEFSMVLSKYECHRLRRMMLALVFAGVFCTCVAFSLFCILNATDQIFIIPFMHRLSPLLLK